MKLTPAELRVLEGYIEDGNLGATAERLGIAESTAKNLLLTARRRVGVRGNVTLAYMLASGELEDS